MRDMSTLLPRMLILSWRVRGLKGALVSLHLPFSSLLLSPMVSFSFASHFDIQSWRRDVREMLIAKRDFGDQERHVEDRKIPPSYAEEDLSLRGLGRGRRSGGDDLWDGGLYTA